MFTAEVLEAEAAEETALNKMTLEARGGDAEEGKAVGRADAGVDEEETDERGAALLTEMGVGAEAEVPMGFAQAVGVANTVDTTVTVTMPSLPITIVGVAAAPDEEDGVMMAVGAEEAEEGTEGISARVTGSLLVTWRL